MRAVEECVKLVDELDDHMNSFYTRVAPGGCKARDPEAQRDSGMLHSWNPLERRGLRPRQTQVRPGPCGERKRSVFRETPIPRFAVGARILWRTRVAGAKGGPTGLQGGQPTYMSRIQDTACMEPMASEIRSRSRLSTPTEGCLGANEVPDVLVTM